MTIYRFLKENYLHIFTNMTLGIRIVNQFKKEVFKFFVVRQKMKDNHILQALKIPNDQI